jgi:hypothetical protein
MGTLFTRNIDACTVGPHLYAPSVRFDTNSSSLLLCSDVSKRKRKDEPTISIRVGRKKHRIDIAVQIGGDVCDPSNEVHKERIDDVVLPASKVDDITVHDDGVYIVDTVPTNTVVDTVAANAVVDTTATADEC